MIPTGYNTTVFILNDGFDQIQKHPADFVAVINRAMHTGGEEGVGIHANCVRVMPTAHADVFRCYASQGNLMLDLSPYSRDTEALIERMPELVRQYIDLARDSLDRLEEKLP